MTCRSRGANAAFEALLAEYLPAWAHCNPGRAVPGAARDRLPGLAGDERSARFSLLESFLAALEEIDPGGLDDVRRLERRLLMRGAVAALELGMIRDPRHEDPRHALPFEAIEGLLRWPPGDFGHAFRALLEAVPGHLRDARALLKESADRIHPRWVDAAVLEIEAGNEDLHRLHGDPRLHRRLSQRGAVDHLLEVAVQELRRHAEFLRSDLRPRATGAAGCGGDELRLRLAVVHGLELDPGALLPWLDDMQARVAGALDACGDVVTPSPGTGVASRWLEGACSHIGRAGLLSVDDLPRPAIGTMPAAAAWQSLGLAYRPPPAGVVGTPVLELARDAAAGVFGTWAEAELEQACAAAGCGGEHWLWITARRAPPGQRPARALASGRLLVHGWGLHARGWLVASGHFGAPAHRRVWLGHLARRLYEARADLEIHLGRVDLDDLAGGAPEVGGTAAAPRLWALSQEPLSGLLPVLGWRLIQALYDVVGPDARGSVPARLAAEGLIPLPDVIRVQFGERILDEVLARFMEPWPEGAAAGHGVGLPL